MVSMTRIVISNDLVREREREREVEELDGIYDSDWYLQ